MSRENLEPLMGVPQRDRAKVERRARKLARTIASKAERGEHSFRPDRILPRQHHQIEYGRAEQLLSEQGHDVKFRAIRDPHYTSPRGDIVLLTNNNGTEIPLPPHLADERPVHPPETSQ